MIELNKEYTYKDCCSALGWSYQASNNKTKERQQRCIEESFEFYHPINPKTHKEKKSYIFTKQIKEPVLEDGRKHNGGLRKDAGRKSDFPADEFDYLWKVMASEAYKRNRYIERSWLNKVYFSTSLLFEMFGFPYQHYVDEAKFEETDTVVRYVFEDILYNALKANTVTRLCKRYGFPKNSLPKGILRSRSKNRPDQKIDDDKLLDTYNEFEAEGLNTLKCSKYNVIRQGKYSKLNAYIQSKFEKLRKYNVQRLNVIQVLDFDVIANGEHFGDRKLITEYREHFREIIFSSVEKSCLRRIAGNQYRYKDKLDEKQKQLLKKYLYNMLGKSEQLSSSDENSCENEEFAWLDLVV